jgi:hypothetical protein
MERSVKSTAVLFLTVFFAGALEGCKPSGGVSSEADAIDAVREATAARNLYADVNDSKCLGYVVESRSASDVDIVIHENHGGPCGGDPGVSPVRDRFKVILGSGNIQRYDPVEGEYAEFR